MRSRSQFFALVTIVGATALECYAQNVVTRSVIASGGGASAAAQTTLTATIGQNFSSVTTGGTLSISAGFWIGIPTACYANCDGSTSTPRLTANDFQCFLNEFASGMSNANCDGSTVAPVLTANDFQCFLNAYASGCP